MIAPWQRRVGHSLITFLAPTTVAAVAATVVHVLEPGSFGTDGYRPYDTILKLYFGLAVLCGILWGLLAPLTRSIVGRSFVAALVTWPAVIAFAFLDDSLSVTSVSLGEAAAAGAIAAVFGPLWAAMMHSWSLKRGSTEALQAEAKSRRRLPWLAGALAAAMLWLFLIW